MKTRDMSRADSQKYIEKKETGRAGFIKKYFKVDASDPSHYDMVINTEKLGIEGAVMAVSGALQYRIRSRAEETKTASSKT